MPIPWRRGAVRSAKNANCGAPLFWQAFNMDKLVYPFKQDPYQVGAEKFRFARRKLQNISKADTSLL
jgi:hypothetical protein